MKFGSIAAMKPLAGGATFLLIPARGKQEIPHPPGTEFFKLAYPLFVLTSVHPDIDPLPAVLVRIIAASCLPLVMAVVEIADFGFDGL